MKNGFKNILFSITRAAVLLSAVIGGASAQSAESQEEYAHTYASLREADLDLKDFVFATLSNEKIRLSEAVKGKKLVLIHYFAAWCHNSNYDVVTINELYAKYRDRGLAVIGVSEYSTKDELRRFIETHKPAYPICIEGDKRKKERTSTTHYAYRKSIDDARVWGTPLNILVFAEEIINSGEIVAARVRIAPGELVKAEVDELIKEKLGKN